jgi:hypothetical protein
MSNKKMPVYIYLNDHRAETLTRVIQQARHLIDQLSIDNLSLALASGNDGVIAATNEVVVKKKHQ